MLMNMTDKVPPLVEKLRQSKFKFYMTGSRMWCSRAGTGPLKALFMAKKNVSSDWDLFVDFNEEVHKWLFANGFDAVNNSGYQHDGQCVTVVERLDSETKDLIQVQLVKNAKAKNVVQEVLLKMYPNGFDSKSQASVAWRYGLNFYDVMEQIKNQ